MKDISSKYAVPIVNVQPSEWQCHLFGGTSASSGITWRPPKGKEPNAFWRWMQYICFGNLWVKDK